jgi:hypothetical protein
MDISYEIIKQLEKKFYEILYEKGYDAISFLKKVKVNAQYLNTIGHKVKFYGSFKEALPP